MREILTVLAGLVALALGAAFVVPPLVDWAPHRARIDAGLSEALGVTVRTRGAIEARLLPEPSLRLEGVDLAASAGETGAAGAELGRTVVRLFVGDLLRGRVAVAQASIENGRIDLPAAWPAADAGTRARLARASLERLDVRSLVLRSGGEPLVEDFEGELSARTLLGPWRVVGVGRVPHLRPEPLAVRASSGEFATEDGEGTRVRASLSGPGEWRAEFDGVGRRPASGGLEGRVSVADPGGAWPVRARGTLRVDAEGARVETLDVDLGAGQRPLRLSGAARRVGPSAWDLALAAPQLDLDGLADAQGDERAGEALAERLLQWTDLAVARGVRVGLDLTADTVLLAREVFRSVSARLDVDGSGWRFETLRATAGGGTELRFGGRVAPGARGTPAAERLARLAANGRVEVTSDEPGRLVALLGGDAGATLRPLVAGTRLQLRTGLETKPGDAGRAWVLDGMELSSGASRLFGRVAWADGAGGRALNVALRAPLLDLDAVPASFAPVLGGAKVEGSLQIDELRWRPSPERSVSGRLSLAGRLADGTAVVEDARYADATGATITGRGRLDGAGGRIELRAEARDVAPVADLVARIWPGAWPDALVARAALLSPLALDLRAERGSAAAPGAAPAAISGAASGQAGRLSVTGRFRSDGARAIPAGTVELSAADGRDLLRVLGVPVASGDGVARRPGTARVVLGEGRGVDRPIEMGLRVADAELALVGTARGGADDAPLVRGDLRLSSGDAAPVLRLLGIEADGPFAARLAARVESSGDEIRLDELNGSVANRRVRGRLARARDGALTGDIGVDEWAVSDWPAWLGPWRAAPVAGPTPALALGPVEVGFHVGRLSLGGVPIEEATGTIRSGPSRVTVDVGAGALAGGPVSGQASMRWEGGRRLAALRAELERVPSAAVGLGALGGAVGGRLEASGSGDALAPLVASLSGGGVLRLEGAAVPGFEPDGVTRAVAALEARDATFEAARIVPTLQRELARGALPLPRLDVPLSVARGVARLGPVTLDADGRGLTGAASLDLRDGTFDARATLLVEPRAKGWTAGRPAVTSAWRGRLGQAAVTRELDATPLVAALTTRAVARELEKLEIETQDLQERARFNRLYRALLWEREKERERREAAVRAAEEERRREREAQEAERRRAAAAAAEEARRLAAERAAERGAPERTPPERTPSERPASGRRGDDEPLNLRDFAPRAAPPAPLQLGPPPR